MVSITRIRADDWAALRDVRLTALAESPEAFGSTLAREQALTDDVWRQRAADGAAGHARLTLLAVDDDRPVGLVSGFRDGDVVNLVGMWTAPAVRRAGVARALVQAVLDWSRDVGAARVDLWVVHGNDPAQRLYESMGFAVTTDHQPHPNDPCKDEVRMTSRV